MPLLGHMHPPFFKIMDDIQTGLRYVFQTSSKYTLLISGTGHAGMLNPIIPARSSPAQPRLPSTHLCSHARFPLQPLMLRAGMEACITNLLEPGETILIGDKGIWGARAADMAGRFGGVVLHQMLERKGQSK